MSLGLGSPMAVGLASRGFCPMSPGTPPVGAKDFAEANRIEQEGPTRCRAAIVITYKYAHTIPIGALRAGADVVREIDAASEDGPSN